MKHIIGINFSDSLQTNELISFYANPHYGIIDNGANRKLYKASSGEIFISNNYAIVSMTDENIVLRNSGVYKFVAGTYYLIAW